MIFSTLVLPDGTAKEKKTDATTFDGILWQFLESASKMFSLPLRLEENEASRIPGSHLAASAVVKQNTDFLMEVTLPFKPSLKNIK